MPFRADTHCVRAGRHGGPVQLTAGPLPGNHQRANIAPFCPATEQRCEPANIACHSTGHCAHEKVQECAGVRRSAQECARATCLPQIPPGIAGCVYAGVQECKRSGSIASDWPHRMGPGRMHGGRGATHQDEATWRRHLAMSSAFIEAPRGALFPFWSPLWPSAALTLLALLALLAAQAPHKDARPGVMYEGNLQLSHSRTASYPPIPGLCRTTTERTFSIRSRRSCVAGSRPAVLFELETGV